MLDEIAGSPLKARAARRRVAVFASIGAHAAVLTAAFALAQGARVEERPDPAIEIAFLEPARLRPAAPPGLTAAPSTQPPRPKIAPRAPRRMATLLKPAPLATAPTVIEKKVAVAPRPVSAAGQRDEDAGISSHAANGTPGFSNNSLPGVSNNGMTGVSHDSGPGVRNNSAPGVRNSSGPGVSDRDASGVRNNGMPGDDEPVFAPSYGAAYLHNPPPQYPAAARRLKLQGTSVLRVLVSAEGSAKSVAVETGSGVALLDDAAVEAVRQWSFVPARQGNKAIAAEVDVPVRFRLGSSAAPPDAPARADFNQGMTPPKLLVGPQLESTAEAREHRVSGQMLVRCVLTIEGSVNDCRVLSGLPFMDQAAVATLQARRYTPATLNGTPLEVYYTFQLTLRPAE